MKPLQLGQSTIETIVALKLIILLCTGASSAIYLSYTKQISDFSLQKSLLCLETLNETSTSCRNKLKNRLNTFLFFNKNISIKISRRLRSNTAQVEFLFLGYQLKRSQKLIKQSAR